MLEITQLQRRVSEKIRGQYQGLVCFSLDGHMLIKDRHSVFTSKFSAISRSRVFTALDQTFKLHSFLARTGQAITARQNFTMEF